MRCRACLILVLFLTIGHAHGQTSVKWTDVTLDQRNYTGNVQATDRAYVTGNINSKQHPAIEYPQTPPVTHAVYIRASTITVAARWTNSNSFALSGTLTWTAARLAVPNTSGGTDYISLTVNGTGQSISLATNGSDTKTLTLTNVPDYVAVGQLQVQYSLILSDGEQTLNNGTGSAYEGWERIALVDAAPDPHGLQAVPWVDLLEYSCRWAYGANGAADLREKLVKGMHLGSRCTNKLIYSYTQDPAYYFVYGGFGDVRETRTIQLSLFLNQISESNVSRQCIDFAAILLLASMAQGRESTFEIVERWLNSSVPGSFYTWPLCPAGTDQTDNGNYSSYSFSFHAVVADGNNRLDSSSSYRYDLAGSTYKLPVWNWPVWDHWQKNVSSVYYGLAYGSDGAHPSGTNVSLGNHIRTNLQPTSVE